MEVMACMESMVSTFWFFAAVFSTREKNSMGLSHKEAAPKYKARLLRRVGLWRII